MNNIEEIVNKLNKAKDDYYNGESLLSDTEFDSLEDRLKELDPGNEYFNLVGAPFKQGSKILHLTRMKSMQKAKTYEEVQKWQKKIGFLNTFAYISLPKIDGLAITVKYNNGNLVYCATRGDGNVGMDVTHIVPFIDDIKETISFTKEEIEIRGEIYLPKDTPYDTKGKALRNNASGLLNRKTDKQDLKYLRCIMYNIVSDNLFETEVIKLDKLKKEGFNVVDYVLGRNLEHVYEEYLHIRREEWNFETDGIVIILNETTVHEEVNSRWKENNHHNQYCIAWKPPAQGKETKLLNIEWQMSRQGNLIPVAIFSPITIGGASIERATLNNFENVWKLDLSIGDVLYVVRSNDVIPYIEENRGGGDNKDLDLIPYFCPHCETKLEKIGVHLHCPNNDCSEQQIQRIIYWVKECDIDNVAEKTLISLFVAKVIKSISDLYKLTPEDLQGLDGFGEKKINNLIEGIQSKRELTASELLSKLNIPLVRTKALKKLEIKTIEDFKSFNDSSSAIGLNIIAWKSKSFNMDILEDLLKILIIKEENIIDEVKGSVCMTGKSDIPRKKLTELIRQKGYEVVSSVTKNTNILLTNDIESTSSKLVKAKKLGIDIKTYKEFFE